MDTINWQPHITVATIVERDGLFLMVREWADQDHPVLNQPAGHVEAHERFEDAARRETLEETGWDVDIINLVGVYVYTPPERPDRTYVRFCYTARPVHHHADRPLDAGIIEAVWLNAEAILSSDQLRSPLVTQCLQDALAGHNLPEWALQYTVS